MRDSSERILLNFGPHNSPAIGPMRIGIRTDADVVLHAEPEVGFLHRGIEKLAEKMTWTGFLPFTDRIDYLASAHCNLAYALAVEKLAQIQVSERASVIRVIVGELNRIASHLLSLGHMASLVGAPSSMMYALRDREKINNLFEMLSGARLTYSYVRIGGVASDITDGFIEKTYEFIEQFLPKLKEYNDLLSSNFIFKGRLANIGVVPLHKAVEMGLSGPALRASGLKHDLRKTQPYAGYEAYDFSTPVGRGEAGSLGDCFDRYIVRIREIEQSVFIVRQALDRLPEGTFQTPIPRIFKPTSGEAYAAVESPRGHFGVYVQSRGEKTPYRVKFKTPSFAVLNIFPDVLENELLSDVGTIVSSFDIMVSEVDR